MAELDPEVGERACAQLHLDQAQALRKEDWQQICTASPNGRQQLVEFKSLAVEFAKLVAPWEVAAVRETRYSGPVAHALLVMGTPYGFGVACLRSVMAWLQ
eukprot:1444314-Alexandrium_andersonii.AAC.1